jgi:hypothetical protein
MMMMVVVVVVVMVTFTSMSGHGMDGRGSVYGSDRDIARHIHTYVKPQVHKASYLVVWLPDLFENKGLGAERYNLTFFLIMKLKMHESQPPVPPDFIMVLYCIQCDYNFVSFFQLHSLLQTFMITSLQLNTL